MTTTKSARCRRVRTALLLSFSLGGCVPAPETVAPDTLPAEARFSPVGNIGQVFRVREAESRVSFPVAPERAAKLLPHTIRLFRFNGQAGAWQEFAASRYDAATGTLVAENAAPGYYTAFGFSADPGENALQRLTFDAQRGFRPADGQLAAPAELRDALAAAGPDTGAELFRNWVQLGVAVPRRVCMTPPLGGAAPRCPLPCTTAPCTGSSCPPACREDQGCCSCITYPERLVLPLSVLDSAALSPCPGWRNGIPCEVCPYGMSCPRGPFAADTLIKPVGVTLDYGVLDRLGLLDVAESPVIQTSWNELAGRTVGEQYPYPPR